MLIMRPHDIKPSEITPKAVYLRRREFIQAAGATLLASAAGLRAPNARAGEKIAGIAKSQLSTIEQAASLKEITNYNNYYEFGTDKYSPADQAKRLKARGRCCL